LIKNFLSYNNGDNLMSKKIAVVISGAVSLGSYEAGVMYEVLEAMPKAQQS
jgi:hypothetical protein